MNTNPEKPPKVCDHTSVGVLAFNDEGNLLLIKRRKGTPGLAPPAGHVDSHGSQADTWEQRFAEAAIEETEEETNLTTLDLKLIAEGRRENPCRRQDGTWHYWRVYLGTVQGDLRPSQEETRGAFWCTKAQMADLLAGKPMLFDGEETLLEPVWLDWFRELDILNHYPS